MNNLSQFFIDNNRLNQIDFFRGVAITIVIIGHVLYHQEINILPIEASFGVFIFFIISGFLITKNISEKKYESTTNFILKRILRIIPLTWLLLLLMHQFTLQNAFFVSNFSEVGYIGHFWSLKIELLFYLIIPFILYYKHHNYLIFGYVILSPLFVYLDFHTELKYLEYGHMFSMLFLGSISYSFRENIANIKCNKTILIISSILFCSLKFLPVHLNELLSVIIFAVYFVKSINNKEIHPSFKKARFIFIFIGRISFSLYVFQQFFTEHPPIKIDNSSILSVLINLIILVVISFVSFIFIENILFKKTLQIFNLK